HFRADSLAVRDVGALKIPGGVIAADTDIPAVGRAIQHGLHLARGLSAVDGDFCAEGKQAGSNVVEHGHVRWRAYAVGSELVNMTADPAHVRAGVAGDHQAVCREHRIRPNVSDMQHYPKSRSRCHCWLPLARSDSPACGVPAALSGSCETCSVPACGSAEAV